jgi:hypothetical protein
MQALRKDVIVKRTVVVASAVGAMLWVGSPAFASPNQDVFDANDATWGCAGDPGVELPAYHCINVKSQGKTGVIKVFEPDARWPQESISTDPKSDTRPCPHDPAAADGTWWSPVPDVWVCHHRP